MDDKVKKEEKKYFDVAPPKPITAPTISTQKRRILSKSIPVESSNTDSNIAVNQKESTTDTLMEPDEAVEEEKVSTVPSRPKLKITPPSEEAAKAKEEAETAEAEAPESDTEKDEDMPAVNPLPGTVDDEPEEPVKDDSKEDETTEDNELKEEKPETESTEQDSQQEEYIDSIDDNKTENDSEEPDKEEVESKDKKEAESPEADKQEAPKEDLTPIPEPYATNDSLPDPGQKKAEELKDNMQEPAIYDTKEFYVPIGRAYHGHGGVKGAFIFGAICAAIVVAAVIYFSYVLNG